MNKIVACGLGVVILGGMGWTVFFDYKPWVHAEKDNYGHGPGEQGTVGVANKMYQENGAAVRINYPESWQVEEVWGRKYYSPVTDVAIFKVPGTTVKVTLQVFTNNESLVDFVNKLAAAKANIGWVANDRQYISSKENLTILTWKERLPGGSARMRQMALAKRGEKLVIVEAESALTEWTVYQGIFWEMYQSLVLL